MRPQVGDEFITETRPRRVLAVHAIELETVVLDTNGQRWQLIPLEFAATDGGPPPGPLPIPQWLGPPLP